MQTHEYRDGKPPRACSDCEPIETRERPGALMDLLVSNLGRSIVERTDRLASDISHNNAQIEKLHWQATQTVAAGILVGLAFGAALVLILEHLR